MTYLVSRDTTIRVQPRQLQLGNEFNQQVNLSVDKVGRLTVQLRQDGEAIGVRLTAAEVQLLRDLIE